MAPTFSIIIPVYNVAPYLAECLDSVRAQTYANWEALCVDDGSTDTSSALLDTYARLDPRIHVTHQRNAGVSSARNRGLEASRGDWIWFVDGDDAIHSNALGALQSIIQKASSKPNAIGIKNLDGSQLPRRWERLCLDFRCFSAPTMQGLWHFWGAAWRTLFARSFLLNRRFQYYRMGEDLLFSISCFVEMKYWFLADMQCYFYRAREGSAMRSLPRVEVVKDWLDVQEKLIQLLFDSGFLHNVVGDKDLFVRLWGGLLYYTDSKSLFRLPLCEMSLCYGQWLDALNHFGSYWVWPLRKRIPILILRIFRLPWLARVLIYWPWVFRQRFLWF